MDDRGYHGYGNLPSGKNLPAPSPHLPWQLALEPLPQQLHAALRLLHQVPVAQGRLAAVGCPAKTKCTFFWGGKDWAFWGNFFFPGGQT